MGTDVRNKRILVGVSGSVAAFKAPTLVRMLREAGAEVRVVMTDNAQRFVGAATLRAISGQAVGIDPWHDDGSGSGEPHVDLSQWADLAIVYQASQAFCGRFAASLGNDLLSLTLLSMDGPVLIAPAMHTRMLAHPLFEAALERLRAAGVGVLPTVSGRLANGQMGPGRLLEPEQALEQMAATLGGGDLQDLEVLVTAGPTREPLDAVRFLSNPSTGRMGLAVARAAARRGARVRLVLGPTELPGPQGVAELVRVETAAEMAREVRRLYPGCQLLVMAAAVADFRPAHPVEGKIAKRDGIPEVVLEGTEDILAATSELPGDPVRVGFAVGTGDLRAAARAKLEAKALDLIVVNNVERSGAGFAVETNRVQVLDAAGHSEDWPLMSKDEVAERLLDRVLALRGHGAPE
jgi:phosphopantothenoylcysteine decarboxylase/phosphopantothenate--cysteine ligase